MDPNELLSFLLVHIPVFVLLGMDQLTGVVKPVVFELEVFQVGIGVLKLVVLGPGVDTEIGDQMDRHLGYYM